MTTLSFNNLIIDKNVLNLNHYKEFDTMKRYIMYLDESGVGSLNDYQDKAFILSALIIQENEDIQFSSYFNYTKKKYKISDNRPFHSYELFEDKKSKHYLTTKKAKSFIKSLSEFINISPFKVIVTAIDKEELRRFLGIPKKFKFKPKEDNFAFRDLPYEVLGRYLFFWFANFLKKKGNDSIGHIVAESRESGDQALLRTFLDSQQENKFKKDARLFRSFVCSIGFEKKLGLSGGLEMIDLISYFSNQFLRRELIKSFGKKGGRLLWKNLKQKLEKQKIQRIRKSGFVKLIPNAKIRKLSNFIKKIR